MAPTIIVGHPSAEAIIFSLLVIGHLAVAVAWNFLKLEDTDECYTIKKLELVNILVVELQEALATHLARCTPRRLRLHRGAK